LGAKIARTLGFQNPGLWSWSFFSRLG
jgi:hypothetical protein